MAAAARALGARVLCAEAAVAGWGKLGLRSVP
jgi:hypothetical protein